MLKEIADLVLNLQVYAGVLASKGFQANKFYSDMSCMFPLSFDLL